MYPRNRDLDLLEVTESVVKEPNSLSDCVLIRKVDVNLYPEDLTASKTDTALGTSEVVHPARDDSQRILQVGRTDDAYPTPNSAPSIERNDSATFDCRCTEGHHSYARGL